MDAFEWGFFTHKLRHKGSHHMAYSSVGDFFCVIQGNLTWPKVYKPMNGFLPNLEGES